MSEAKAGSPVRRIVLASAVLVLLLVSVSGASIWSYDRALDKADRAWEARAQRALTYEATTAFWRERAAMNGYLLAPSPERLSAVDAADSEWRDLMAGLSADAGTPG